MKTISILGCGWLGLPLAEYLKTCGFSVKGSTTTQAKIFTLEQSGVQPFLIDVDPLPDRNVLSAFFESDILFLNLPFRRSFKDPYQYKRQIDCLLPSLNQSSIKFVIFAGSTSIYPEDVVDARDDQPVHPTGDRSKVLRAIEQGLMSHPNFQTTVIRFAGLYGGHRRIGGFLSGWTAVKNAGSPVNLIHLDDCLEIVYQIIERDLRRHIFNAVSDCHPFKKELYTRAALNCGLQPPVFLEQEQCPRKIVNNRKLKFFLGYRFKHPDPLGDI